VIRENLDGSRGWHRDGVVSKVLEAFDNCKKFLVSYVIVDIHWQKLVKVLCDGMEKSIITLLQEHSRDGKVRGIHLDGKCLIKVVMVKYREGVKAVLRVSKVAVHLEDQSNLASLRRIRVSRNIRLEKVQMMWR
jgi:hypothetical protein